MSKDKENFSEEKYIINEEISFLINFESNENENLIIDCQEINLKFAEEENNNLFKCKYENCNKEYSNRFKLETHSRTHVFSFFFLNKYLFNKQ